MNLSEINWDPNASGTWPTPVKAVVTGIVCLIIAGAWFYLDTMEQINQLETATKQETSLKQEFEQKHHKAINRVDYEFQLTQIEAELYEMIRQMPTKEEVANLLIDISQMGMANGLDFRLFKLLPAVQKDFYSELPINIEVIGKYDALGIFVSGLAALPRIVTVHDVTILPPSSKSNEKKEKQASLDDNLVMRATIKTYNESQASGPAAQSSGKANTKRVTK